jgi:UDP-N-acetylglucosamine 4,6-dehydratase
MGSRGSVIPLFNEQKKSGTLTITDERMTRFWITLRDAVNFVITSFEIMQSGEIFVPKIPSLKVVDLAQSIAPRAKLKIIGIRTGEKLHEDLITRYEGMNTYELDDRYIIFLSSNEEWKENMNEYNKDDLKKVKSDFEFTSLNNELFLTCDQMKKILKKNGLV